MNGNQVPPATPLMAHRKAIEAIRSLTPLIGLAILHYAEEYFSSALSDDEQVGGENQCARTWHGEQSLCAGSGQWERTTRTLERRPNDGDVNDADVYEDVG